MAPRSTQLKSGRQIDELVAAREHLCTVRDTLPAYYAITKELDEIVGKIEKLLGY